MSMHNIKKQLAAAWGYSMNRLALNDFSLYEFCMQEDIPEEIRHIWDQLQTLTGRFLEGENPAEELKALRGEISGQAERPIFYGEALKIYEHVLNRLTARFYETDGPAAETDPERIQWILRYILADKDAYAINQRLLEVMEQLPIRLTKQKFFTYLRKSLLQYYKGNPKSSMERELFKLRTASFIGGPEDLRGSYRQLGDCLRELEAQDLRNVSSEEYERLKALLGEAAGRVEDYIWALSAAAEMAGDLLTAAMARRRLGEAGDEPACIQVLQAVLEGVKKGGDEPLSEELLKPLEGRQETWYERWDACAVPMDRLERECREDMDAELLRQISILLSNNEFADLEYSEPDRTPLSGPEAEEMVSQFERELSESWNGKHRLFVRAVMARLLGSMPVFLDSLDQIREYISGSMESCTDEMEKEITMALLRRESAQGHQAGLE